MTEADLAALLGPVRAGNAFEETVERLLTVIKLGLVARGNRFPPERELATLLGVSRLTLREAIKALQQAGYVESRRGRFGGTFVTYTRPAPDPKEVRRIALEDSGRLTDALTFRLVVEIGAAEVLAAQVLAQSGGEHGRPGEEHGRPGGEHGRPGGEHGRPGEEHGRPGEEHGRTDGDRSRAHPARPAGGRQQRHPGGLPEAGHPVPPVHRGAHRVQPAGRSLYRRQNAAERPAQRDPGAPAQHRSHGRTAHRHRGGDPGG